MFGLGGLLVAATGICGFLCPLDFLLLPLLVASNPGNVVTSGCRSLRIGEAAIKSEGPQETCYRLSVSCQFFPGIGLAPLVLVGA